MWLEARRAQVPAKPSVRLRLKWPPCPLGSCPHAPQPRLGGRHTYDGSGRPLRPRDGAVRNAQGEGFTVALVYCHLPPDTELAHGAPTSRETNELDFWCPGEGPGHDDRLVGWLWTIANLEKEAMAAGHWKQACSGTEAAVTLPTGLWSEKLEVTLSIKWPRVTSMTSTCSEVTRLAGTSRPLHMLFPLPGTASALVCLVNSYSYFKTQYGSGPPLESCISCSFYMSPLLGSESAPSLQFHLLISTFFLPDHTPSLSSQIPECFLCHSSYRVFVVLFFWKTVSNLRWCPVFILPPPHPTTSSEPDTEQEAANIREP